jgi:hemerythrin-like domain-containing protein
MGHKSSRHRSDATLEQLIAGEHAIMREHLQTEEEVVYPAIDRVADADWSSQAMRLDHEAIKEMLGQLDRAIADIRRARWLDEVQRALFVLEAVIRLHLDKEERMSRAPCAQPTTACVAPSITMACPSRSALNVMC